MFNLRNTGPNFRHSPSLRFVLVLLCVASCVGTMWFSIFVLAKRSHGSHFVRQQMVL